MATPAVLTGDRPARCPRRNRRPGDIPQHGPSCIGADRRATRPDQSTPGRRPTGPRLHAPGPARYPTISHHTTRLSQPSHRGGSAYLTRAGPTTPRRRDIRTLQPRPQSSTLEDLVPDCKFLGHATCPTHRETRQGNGGILQSRRVPLLPELLHAGSTGTPTTYGRGPRSRHRAGHHRRQPVDPTGTRTHTV